jgi:hypothetical protein
VRIGRFAANRGGIWLPGAGQEYADRFAQDTFRMRLFQAFDPERPDEDPNELARRMRGMGPQAMLHNCPCCHDTMEWDLFRAHLRPCYVKWRSVTLDITKRKFAGASLEVVRG